MLLDGQGTTAGRAACSGAVELWVSAGAQQQPQGRDQRTPPSGAHPSRSRNRTAGAPDWGPAAPGRTAAAAAPARHEGLLPPVQPPHLQAESQHSMSAASMGSELLNHVVGAHLCSGMHANTRRDMQKKHRWCLPLLAGKRLANKACAAKGLNPPASPAAADVACSSSSATEAPGLNKESCKQLAKPSCRGRKKAAQLVCNNAMNVSQQRPSVPCCEHMSESRAATMHAERSEAAPEVQMYGVQPGLLACLQSVHRRHVACRWRVKQQRHQVGNALCEMSRSRTREPWL